MPVTDAPPDWQTWLLSTPWWVPGLLALVLAAYLVWLTLAPSKPLPALPAEPANAPAKVGELDLISGQDFTGQVVFIDDKHFRRCTFLDSTLSYQGGNYKFEDCSILQPIQFVSSSDSLGHFLQLLNEFGMLDQAKHRLTVRDADKGSHAGLTIVTYHSRPET